MNKDKKIKLQQSVIDSLIQENKDLKSKLANVSEEYENEKASPEKNQEKVKELIIELEDYIAEYKKLIGELKEKKEQYTTAIKEIKKLKVEYSKKLKEMMKDIKRGVK